MQLRSRFAPTPSGYLHEGNAYSFIMTWLMVRRAGGQIVLRIDDLDAARKRPEFVEDIFASLEWLGLDYDEGPSGPTSFETEFSQRHRIDLYEAALFRLRDSDQCFPCACTRASVRQTSDGFHPPACRSAGTSFEDADIAWRVPTPDESVNWCDADGRQHAVLLDKSLRDVVVRRKGGLPAYQLASLVDDCHFRINHIVRGEDLLESTAAQRMLASKLGDDKFLQAEFFHHPLVLDGEGEKLAKSDGAISLKSMRDAQATPQLLYQRFATWIGLAEVVEDATAALAVWNAISNPKEFLRRHSEES